jgi:hypothetical protein
MDDYEGNSQDPISLHKYLYAANDPIGLIDPSGKYGITIGQVLTAVNILLTISSISTFIQDPNFTNVFWVAIGLVGLRGVGTGLRALCSAGKLKGLAKIVNALKSVVAVTSIEAKMFNWMRGAGYASEFTENALQLVNSQLGNATRKVVEAVYSNMRGGISLIEAKTTLTAGKIGESLSKVGGTIETLEEISKAGGQTLQSVDELIIGYEKLGNLGKYILGPATTSVNGQAVYQVLYSDSGKQVVAKTVKGAVEVFVAQF